MARQTFLSDPKPQTSIQNPITDNSTAQAIQSLTPVVKEAAHTFQKENLLADVTQAQAEREAGVKMLENLKGGIAARQVEILEGEGNILDVAEDQEVKKLEGQLKRLKAGKVSGTLTDETYAARIDSLVRSASNRAPAFSKSFRSIGSTAKTGGTSSSVMGAFSKEEKLEAQRIAAEDAAIDREFGGDARWKTGALREHALKQINIDFLQKQIAEDDVDNFIANGLGGTIPDITKGLQKFKNPETGLIDNADAAIGWVEQRINIAMDRVYSNPNLDAPDTDRLIKALETQKKNKISRIKAGNVDSQLEFVETRLKTHKRLQFWKENESFMTLMEAGVPAQAIFEMKFALDQLEGPKKEQLIKIKGGLWRYVDELTFDTSSFASDAKAFMEGVLDPEDPVFKYLSRNAWAGKATPPALEDPTADPSTPSFKDRTLENIKATTSIQDNKLLLLSPDLFREMSQDPEWVKQWNLSATSTAMAPFLALDEGWEIAFDPDAQGLMLLDENNQVVSTVFAPIARTGRAGIPKRIRDLRESFTKSREKAFETRTVSVPAGGIGGITLEKTGEVRKTSPISDDKMQALLSTLLIQKKLEGKVDSSISDSVTFGENLINAINTGKVPTVEEPKKPTKPKVDMSGEPVGDREALRQQSDESNEAAQDMLKTIKEKGITPGDLDRINVIKESDELSQFIDQFIKNTQGVA